MNFADFSLATFMNFADFSYVTFYNPVDFSYVTFYNPVDFSGAKFKNSIDFYKTKIPNYKETKAVEILKQIQNGENVTLVNCRIVGELNVSNITLETVSNPYYIKLRKEGHKEEDLINLNLTVSTS